MSTPSQPTLFNYYRPRNSAVRSQPLQEEENANPPNGTPDEQPEPTAKLRRIGQNVPPVPVKPVVRKRNSRMMTDEDDVEAQEMLEPVSTAQRVTTAAASGPPSPLKPKSASKKRKLPVEVEDHSIKRTINPTTTAMPRRINRKSAPPKAKKAESSDSAFEGLDSSGEESDLVDDLVSEEEQIASEPELSSADEEVGGRRKTVPARSKSKAKAKSKSSKSGRATVGASQSQKFSSRQALSAATNTKKIDIEVDDSEALNDNLLEQLDQEEELGWGQLDWKDDKLEAVGVKLGAEMSYSEPEEIVKAKMSENTAVALIDGVKAEEEDERLNHYLNRVPVAKGPDARYWKAFVQAYYAHHRIFSFPPWIDPAKLKDHEGRSPEDPEFELGRIQCNLNPKRTDTHRMHFTPAVLQFWEVKKDHFDKIVFFKMGKFYELFYTDACIMQPIGELKWMGHDEKAHIGFPESSLHQYAKIAVDAGFTVTVVEQMETPGELQERAKQIGGGVKPKAVKREICEVYSQGTLAHPDMIGPEPTYLMAIMFEQQLNRVTTESYSQIGIAMTDTSLSSAFKLRNTSGSFSFVLIDVASSRVFYGSMSDETPTRPVLRSLLSHTSPREVLLHRRDLSPEVSILLNTLPCKPQLTYVPPGQPSSMEIIISDLNMHLFGSSEEDRVFTPPESVTAAKREMNKEAACCPALAVALLSVCEYLETLLLREKLMAFANIQPWSSMENKAHLVLDAAVMRALEILEARSGDSSDSLFAQVNRCKSAFGGRLLRRWVSAPLTDPVAINRRLDAVEWIKDRPQLMADFREEFARLPDVERHSARVCSQALTAERGAVFFSDTAQKKIKAFVDLTEKYRLMDKLPEKLLAESLTDDSETRTRLHDLLRKQADGGLFPDLLPVIESLVESIQFLPNGEYAPKKGAFADFDTATTDVTEQENNLKAYLKSDLWSALGVSPSRPEAAEARFAHVKYRYEVEVSDKFWRELSRNNKGEVVMTSTRAGVTRFHNDEIKRMVYELEGLETKRSNQLYPFMQRLFRSFYDRSDLFMAAVNILAEVDVLVSLAYLAEEWSQQCQVCRPAILEYANSDLPCSLINIKEGYHPVLFRRIPNFIPNDVEIGGEGEGRTIVITGPNMGGKSTLARQVALLTILAQMGSFVPAESMALTPIDRVFARIGAYDAILEGKSTFYVELEETLSFLQQSTSRSLGIIDEFGRGTSIEEGAALAISTAKYITDSIGALCLFSTHFQDQLEANLDRSNDLIQFYHMAAEPDEETKKVVFLYKFEKGICPKAYGLRVARMAGMPEDVLAGAE